MTKKPKTYVGDIPFDVFGNQLHYPDYDYAETFTAKDWDGTNVCVEHGWGEDAKRIKLTAFSHKQMGLELFDTPRKSRFGLPSPDEIGKYNRVIWIPNYAKKDTLVYDTYGRGRSAAYFYFKSSLTGRKVTVFMTDMNDSFIPNMVRGEVSGTFTFCKRGGNYGCVRIGD